MFLTSLKDNYGTFDVVEEFVAVEQAIEEAIDPQGSAVVYSLHFDERVVNDWIDE